MKVPTTSLSLLERIREGDEISWHEFFERYQPFIIALGRSRGLTWEESDDLVQLVMMAFFGESRHFVYHPEMGRFHNYLGTIIRNQTFDLLRRRQTRAAHFTALDSVDKEAMEDVFDAAWRQEYQKQMFRDALQELKAFVSVSTWQAYELYAVQQRNADDVAAHLNMTKANIYNCKTRCDKQMKKILEKMGYEI